jgi:hypothetical protein
VIDSVPMDALLGRPTFRTVFCFCPESNIWTRCCSWTVVKCPLVKPNNHKKLSCYWLLCHSKQIGKRMCDGKVCAVLVIPNYNRSSGSNIQPLHLALVLEKLGSHSLGLLCATNVAISIAPRGPPSTRPIALDSLTRQQIPG